MLLLKHQNNFVCFKLTVHYIFANKPLHKPLFGILLYCDTFPSQCNN